MQVDLEKKYLYETIVLPLGNERRGGRKEIQTSDSKVVISLVVRSLTREWSGLVLADSNETLDMGTRTP